MENLPTVDGFIAFVMEQSPRKRIINLDKYGLGSYNKCAIGLYITKTTGFSTDNDLFNYNCRELVRKLIKIPKYNIIAEDLNIDSYKSFGKLQKDFIDTMQ